MARGPSQIVDNLQVARVEAFDITGLKDGTHRRTLVIDRAPPRVVYDTMHVTATVEIARKMRERVFSKINVQVIGVGRAKAFPSQVDVRVVGAPEFVTELRADQIVPRVTVKESDSTKKSGSVELPVELGMDDVDVSIVPKTVVVRW